MRYFIHRRLSIIEDLSLKLMWSVYAVIYSNLLSNYFFIIACVFLWMNLNEMSDFYHLEISMQYCHASCRNISYRMCILIHSHVHALSYILKYPCILDKSCGIFILSMVLFQCVIMTKYFVFFCWSLFQICKQWMRLNIYFSVFLML